MESDGRVTKPGGRLHPSLLANISAESILKLQKFSLWIDHMSRSTGKTDKKLIKEELALYKDIKTKSTMQVQYLKVLFPKRTGARATDFIKLQIPEGLHAHILLNNLVPSYHDTLHYSLTDFGICSTVNGNALKKTYAASEKVDTIGAMIDPRAEEREALKIRGSGGLYDSTYWLNTRSGRDGGRSRGSVSLAINNWLDYFAVRYH